MPQNRGKKSAHNNARLPQKRMFITIKNEKFWAT